MLLAPSTACAELALEPVGEYEEPVYVTSDPDDAERLFIVEKAGRIRLTAAGRTSTFLDQRARTNTEGWERGLLSMAFAPDFAETRLFYVFYTHSQDGSVRVDELRAKGDVAEPRSRRNVLTVAHPQEMHNGGQLHFGPDGYLYVSIGDGGERKASHRNSQDPTTLLGTLLRIDPRQSGADPYTVPDDNPFVGTENAVEIWSWGLRNPWRFSFDRETDALMIGDVGAGSQEEINFRPQEVGGGRGDNFGWSCREGFGVGLESPECEGAEPEEFVEPVFDYPVTRDPDCAIIGGYVVRDPSLAGLDGRYLYADLCTGGVRSIALDLPLADDDCSEGLSVPAPSSFGEDAEGGIYIASLYGAVSRIVGESERRDCLEVAGRTESGKTPRTVGLLGGGVLFLMAGALVVVRPRFVSGLADWDGLDPLGRRVRIAGAVILIGGIAAAEVSLLAEELGLSAGGLGWKRIALLAAGGVAAAAGALIVARPRIVSNLLGSRPRG